MSNCIETAFWQPKNSTTLQRCCIPRVHGIDIHVRFRNLWRVQYLVILFIDFILSVAMEHLWIQYNLPRKGKIFSPYLLKMMIKPQFGKLLSLLEPRFDIIMITKEFFQCLSLKRNKKLVREALENSRKSFSLLQISKCVQLHKPVFFSLVRRHCREAYNLVKN